MRYTIIGVQGTRKMRLEGTYFLNIVTRLDAFLGDWTVPELTVLQGVGGWLLMHLLILELDYI